MTGVVTIIDYGIGNLLSVARAIEAAGGQARFATRFAEVRDADRILLPGVGAFEPCMTTLEDKGLADAVKAFADSGRPFLGICVGMQLLFDVGLEFGEHVGLGLISGRVSPIPQIDAAGTRKVPHIGWSPLLLPPARHSWDGTILSHAEPGVTSAYFVHSFNCEPADPAVRLAEVDYEGFRVCAAVRRDNVTGFQCHPEKSGTAGLTVISRFLAE